MLPLKRLDKRKNMKITKLEKKKRLYLLELDNDQKLYITEDTIVKYFLSKEKEISEEELKEIQEFAQYSYGKNLALYHLSFKARTTKEVRDYLTKYEIDTEIIDKVVQHLKEEKWLDDRQYARNLIEANLISGDKGPVLLQQKIQQKGVPKSILQEILADYDFTEVISRTAIKLQKKYQGKYPLKAIETKIIQGLISKGFAYNQAKIAFQNLELEADEETTNELILKELEKQYRKYSKKYEGYDLKQRLTQALARKGYDYSDITSAIREFLDS